MAKFIATVLAILAMNAISVSASSEAELTTDFFIPPGHVNSSTLDANYFIFCGLKGGVTPPPAAGKFGVTKVFSNVFTALTGLGVSASLLQFTPHSINLPHTHPRGTELLYVISGTLTVGLIDSTNKLFEKALVAGDMFVFPKGLVHYQINMDASQSTTAFSAFSSSNPGLVSLPSTLFGSKIPSSVLEKSFNVVPDVIKQLGTPFQKP